MRRATIYIVSLRRIRGHSNSKENFNAQELAKLEKHLHFVGVLNEKGIRVTGKKKLATSGQTKPKKFRNFSPSKNKKLTLRNIII